MRWPKDSPSLDVGGAPGAVRDQVDFVQSLKRPPEAIIISSEALEGILRKPRNTRRFSLAKSAS